MWHKEIFGMEDEESWEEYDDEESWEEDGWEDFVPDESVKNYWNSVPEVSRVSELMTPYDQDWWQCGDIRVIDDAGETVYTGPKWVRCAYQVECGQIVTSQQVSDNGGCPGCGGKKLVAAIKLRQEEIEEIQAGRVPLCEWERELVFGEQPEG